jgi:hypothetical protein
MVLAECLTSAAAAALNCLLTVAYAPFLLTYLLFLKACFYSLHAALEDAWVPILTRSLLVRSVLLGSKGLPNQVP